MIFLSSNCCTRAAINFNIRSCTHTLTGAQRNRRAGQNNSPGSVWFLHQLHEAHARGVPWWDGKHRGEQSEGGCTSCAGMFSSFWSFAWKASLSVLCLGALVILATCAQIARTILCRHIRQSPGLGCCLPPSQPRLSAPHHTDQQQGCPLPQQSNRSTEAAHRKQGVSDGSLQRANDIHRTPKLLKFLIWRLQALIQHKLQPPLNRWPPRGQRGAWIVWVNR